MLFLELSTSWALNQDIRMISERSCDTEDWSNDAENSALPSQKYITFQKIRIYTHSALHDAIEEPFCLNGSIKNL